MSSNESHIIIISSKSNWIKQTFETFAMLFFLNEKFNKDKNSSKIVSTIFSLKRNEFWYQYKCFINFHINEIKLFNDTMLYDN